MVEDAIMDANDIKSLARVEHLLVLLENVEIHSAPDKEGHPLELTGFHVSTANLLGIRRFGRAGRWELLVLLRDIGEVVDTLRTSVEATFLPRHHLGDLSCLQVHNLVARALTQYSRVYLVGTVTEEEREIVQLHPLLKMLGTPLAIPGVMRLLFRIVFKLRVVVTWLMGGIGRQSFAAVGTGVVGYWLVVHYFLDAAHDLKVYRSIRHILPRSLPILVNHPLQGLLHFLDSGEGNLIHWHRISVGQALRNNLGRSRVPSLLPFFSFEPVLDGLKLGLPSRIYDYLRRTLTADIQGDAAIGGDFGLLQGEDLAYLEVELVG